MRIGARIGAYEVIAKLGEGGMGEVFRAVDTHLNRTVAIKMLPSVLARDPDRLARFEREAHTLAALNHPNIAQVYGFEKGVDPALVMEFVDGPTLADRIRTGPLPLDEAMPIALQIAEALEAAHDLGIVHRDLKPANIKIRPDGTVKVLDFGLAKAATSDASRGALADSPTITSPAMTGAGVILGTAAYMSPEQAKGRVVDRRADIWAFGCVLFEMLSGRRAFAGDDVGEVLVSLLRDDPPWQALPASTPHHVRDLVRRCLEKDIRKRVPHIGVARQELSEPPRAGAMPALRRGLAPVWMPIAALLGALAIGVPAYFWWPQPGPPVAPTRVQFDLGVTVPPLLTAIALAPNGRTIAFTIVDNKLQSRLYVRPLDRLDAQLIGGTDGAQGPFFSPDGHWVGFVADGKLKKVAVGGGPITVIGDAPSARDGSWGEDNAIVFAAPGALRRMPSSGGPVETIVTSDGSTPGSPQVLPGARGVLYAQASRGDASSVAIFVLDFQNGQARQLIDAARFPRYAPSGHLLFFRGATMFAAPFDLETLSLKGEEVPVADVQNVPGLIQPVMAISSDGTLIYQQLVVAPAVQLPVTWLTRDGGTSALMTTPSAWMSPRFSPDGRRLALTLMERNQFDIWVYDLERDVMTRVTSDPANDILPVWTRDGAGLVFGSSRGSTVFNLYLQRADGTGAAQRLTTSSAPQLPDAIDPSGRALVFHEGDPSTGRLDLMRLPLEGDMTQGLKAGPATNYISGPSLKANARISPDGKWIAYAATDTGASEIYVEPFNEPGTRVQVSNGGGAIPMWAPKTNELLYATQQNRLMTVTYTAAGTAFTPSRPRPWTEARFSAFPPISSYGPGLDIHPDGTRVAASAGSAEGRPQVTPGVMVAVFNFFDELRRLAPNR